MEQENDYQEEPKKRSPFDALIPRKEYFFTPILLDINLLIFVVMIIYGVSPMAPSGDQLIDWGANYRPKTLGGEPWRLFTSMFLHFGVFHIAFNMYALYSLGSMLEPFIGRWRFLVLYLIAGLGGSAVSLWWHDDNAVAAGASGAIFGIFGVLAALLTTNLIDPSVRGQMLKSVAISIGLNLMIGLSGGIDNSAHIGGLLTGALGGYLSYFDLRAWYQRRIKQNIGLIAAVVLSAGIVAFFWVQTSSKPENKFSKHERAIFLEQEIATQFYQQIDSTTTNQEYLEKGILPWKRALLHADSMLDLELTPREQQLAEHYQLYLQLQLESGQYNYRISTEDRPDLADSLKNVVRETDSVIKVIEKLQKQ